MGSGKHSEQRRHESSIEDGNNPNMKCTTHLTGSDAQLLAEILELAQNGAGMALENLADGSEKDPFPVPLKQWDAQARFKVAHLLRDVGLRNAQSICRPAKASCLRNGKEIAQMTDFDWVLNHSQESLPGTCSENKTS
jgi:hypothetical protein